MDIFPRAFFVFFFCSLKFTVVLEFSYLKTVRFSKHDVCSLLYTTDLKELPARVLLTKTESKLGHVSFGRATCWPHWISLFTSMKVLCHGLHLATRTTKNNWCRTVLAKLSALSALNRTWGGGRGRKMLHQMEIDGLKSHFQHKWRGCSQLQQTVRQYDTTNV